MDDMEVEMVKSEAEGKHRAGRPRKGEVREFNLKDFLSEHRPSDYRFLSETEARWLCSTMLKDVKGC